MLNDFESIIENLADEADRVLSESSDRFIHEVKALTFGALDLTIRDIDLAIQGVVAPSADASNGNQGPEYQLKVLHEKIPALKGILAEGRPSAPAGFRTA
jgi:hypothetical protein